MFLCVVVLFVSPLFLSNNAATELSTPPDMAHTTCRTKPMLLKLQGFYLTLFFSGNYEKSGQPSPLPLTGAAMFGVRFKTDSVRKHTSNRNDGDVGEHICCNTTNITELKRFWSERKPQRIRSVLNNANALTTVSM